MTIDSGEKNEAESANLRACDKFTVTRRAHEQTFAYDVFFFLSLSHKIWANFLMYTSK